MDISALGEALRWGAKQALRWLPQKLLRKAWTNNEVLALVHVQHFEQAPCFFVGPSRLPALSFGGFNISNFSPFKLQLVGADIRISIDSEEWLAYRERFPSASDVTAMGRGGFHMELPLNSSAVVDRFRAYPEDSVRMSLRGHLFFQSVFGELRKEVNSTVLATLEREKPIRRLGRSAVA
jgi:hypothetical protein